MRTKENGERACEGKKRLQGTGASQITSATRIFSQGDWDILAGQFFQNWDPERHVKSFGQDETGLPYHAVKAIEELLAVTGVTHQHDRGYSSLARALSFDFSQILASAGNLE